MTQYDQAKQEYLRSKVMTASPEELHLMLIEGAIKFTEEAKSALADGNIEQTHNSCVRAQNIMLELSSELDHDGNPEVCGRLASLYNFIYRRLVDGNLHHDSQAFDDAIKILGYQRETWQQLIERISSEKTQQTGADNSQQADNGQSTGEARPTLSVSA